MLPAPFTVVVWIAFDVFVIVPPNVSVLLEPLSVMVRLPALVIAPVPKFRSFVPPKVKLPPKVIVLLLVRVSEPAVVLSMVPPLMVNVPVPSAVALLILKVVPLASVVPPL